MAVKEFEFQSQPSSKIKYFLAASVVHQRLRLFICKIKGVDEIGCHQTYFDVNNLAFVDHIMSAATTLFYHFTMETAIGKT